MFPSFFSKTFDVFNKIKANWQHSFSTLHLISQICLLRVTSRFFRQPIDDSGTREIKYPGRITKTIDPTRTTANSPLKSENVERKTMRILSQLGRRNWKSHIEQPWAVSLTVDYISHRMKKERGRIQQNIQNDI